MLKKKTSGAYSYVTSAKKKTSGAWSNVSAIKKKVSGAWSKVFPPAKWTNFTISYRGDGNGYSEVTSTELYVHQYNYMSTLDSYVLVQSGNKISLAAGDVIEINVAAATNTTNDNRYDPAYWVAQLYCPGSSNGIYQTIFFYKSPDYVTALQTGTYSYTVPVAESYAQLEFRVDQSASMTIDRIKINGYQVFPN